MKHKKILSTGVSRLGRGRRLPRPALSHVAKAPAKAAVAVKSAAKRFTTGRKQPTMIESLNDLPRITNETVAEHREQVLRGARKYIYPLQHSRANIIKVSVTLFVAAI